MLIKQNHLNEERRRFHIKILKRITRGRQSGNNNSAKRECTLIAEVDSVTYEEMLRIEKLSIGWKKCRVVNHINVKRCYNCWGFYHIAKNCTRPITCSKCTGDHKDNDCKTKKEKCVNCMYKNKAYNLKVNKDHSALSRECPTFKKLLEEEKKKVG